MNIPEKNSIASALPTCRRMALIFAGSRKDFASADWETKKVGVGLRDDGVREGC